MQTVKVIPQYGYGWEKGGQVIGVPGPFKVDYDVSEKSDVDNVYKVIIGTVSELGHIFNGMWILIAVRTLSKPPTYNVFVYTEKPPFYRGENIDALCIPRAASGFATLEA